MSEDDSDERLEAWLLQLENEDRADRRAELTGDRWLSLIHDPQSAAAYVFRHGMDETEGVSIPADAEIWRFDSYGQAERAYAALLGEAAAEGELVEPDSEAEGLGDVETDGLETEELYADTDDVEDGDETQDIDALIEEEEGSGGGEER